MTELIKITEHNGNQAVSARDLYDYLEINERFSRWFDRMCTYGLIEDVDYTPYQNVHPLNNQEILDFILTLDCAKEISMIQRSVKGKMARAYFIEAEKRLNRIGTEASNMEEVMEIVNEKFQIPQTLSEALRLAAENQETIEYQQKVIDLQKEELKESAPKAMYYDQVMQSQSTYNINQIAKELGMSGVTLNKKLKELKVQYRQAGTWVLYSKYQNNGFTKTKTYTFTGANGEVRSDMRTVWTEKGRKFIHDLINSKV